MISFDPDIYISAIAPALNDKIFVAGDVREVREGRGGVEDDF